MSECVCVRACVRACKNVGVGWCAGCGLVCGVRVCVWGVGLCVGLWGCVYARACILCRGVDGCVSA